MSQSSYPQDLTGTASTNLVKDELHTLTEINSSTYRILIPTFSPFYLRNLKLEHVNLLGEATELKEGVDYYPCLPYMAASRSTGQPVYGGLSILTTLIEGTLRLAQYQTVGGPWCCDIAYVYQQLLEATYNARTTWWDSITNVQDTFPPTEHQLPVGEIDGITDLLVKMEAIRNAILSSPSSVPPEVLQHVIAKGNPHALSKLDIGLENVMNYEAATDDEVVKRLPLDKTVTLRQILLLIK